MKVKEVYRYLNILANWENDLMCLMGDSNLLTRVIETHKKSSVFASETDEIKEIVDKDLKHTFDEYLNFWSNLINEKQKIYGLIEKAKAENGISDTMLSINKSYRALINVLKNGNLKCNTRTSIRTGTGFIKSAEGVGTYNYDIEVSVVPKHDVKYFLENLDKYNKIADDISEKIDAFNTNVDIDYIPKWSIHCKLENILDV